MITQERVKALLDYDPRSGIFTWKVGRGYQGCSVARVGDIAGCKHKTIGYVFLTLDYVCYRAHRIAWLYVYGCFPNGCLDHKNGIRNDNRIDNLRAATSSQNCANSKARSNKLKGAYKMRNGRWRARIREAGKLLHLGTFESELEAGQAYFNRAMQTFGEFARAA
jgi:hypothetical protein